MAYITFKDVTKVYQVGEIKIKALNGINFEINQGEFVVVVGASGAGKSTVLNILGGMDHCTQGHIEVDGRIISNASTKELTTYRRHDIGFVFQFYNLVQNLTALENVELATQICKEPIAPLKIMEQVGLSHRLNNFPSQLSGGEQQRVSIARALAKNPKLLLCDEPTGALDDETGRQILQLLHDTSTNHQMTVVLITHNYAITPIADKIIHVKNGLVTQVDINENKKQVSEIKW